MRRSGAPKYKIRTFLQWEKGPDFFIAFGGLDCRHPKPYKDSAPEGSGKDAMRSERQAFGTLLLWICSIFFAQDSCVLAVGP